MALKGKLKGQFNNFYIKELISMYTFSQTSLNKLKGVHPNLVNFLKELILISPWDFKITAGVRTAAEQNLEYQKGRRWL